MSIDANKTLSETILAELIGFDTTSHFSNTALIDYIEQRLATVGIACRHTWNDEHTKANLWATIGPDIPGGLVLSGHTDVVPVEGQLWASDPFVLDRRDGKLYGRGTADMKGFIACALAFAENFSQRNLAVPIHFAFTYDEEVGCLGVHGLLQDVIEQLPKPNAVIVGEPTSMKIIGGSKGGRSYRTRITGVDGHSSLPDLGANAILAASRIIQKLSELEQRLKEAADPDNGFVPPYSSLDLGTIHGGTASNIIPAHCEFAWGFRGLPGEDMQAIEDEILSFIDREVLPGLKAVSVNTGVETIKTSDVAALMPDEQSSAEQLVRHLTQLNQSGRVSYATEAGAFQAAGIPGVIFGPGSIEQAHLPDEYLSVEQLHACCDFMSQLGDWAETGRW